MSTNMAATSTRTVTGHDSHITGIGGVKQNEDYEILVSLMPAGGPPKPLSDNNDSTITSDQILFDTTVERIYQSRATTSGKPSSVSAGRRDTSLPRQIVVESHRSKFRIPMDSSFGVESVSCMVSRMDIPFHLEKNIYWRRLAARPSPSWIAVESTAELSSHIVETVCRNMRRHGDGGGKKVEVKMVLNIAKKSRVGEAEYQGICRAIEEGQAMDDLEKDLIHCQDRHAASSSNSGGRLMRMSVDELKLEAEERVRRINGSALMTTTLDLDSVTWRASKEWERTLSSKLNKALVLVGEEQQRQEGDFMNKNGECSICLAPKLPSTTNSVVRLPNCIHTFHRDCLLQWLLHTPSCPLCRSSPLPSLYRR